MSFVSSVIEHTRLYESPHSFWLWSAYACIAGVVRDNIWMKDGDGRLYPNVYILLLAGSAQKKARPVNLAEIMVYECGNVNVISGRSSIQAILIEIGHTETDVSGKIKKGGSAIFFAPELSAGIVQDDQSIQILTDIYDYKPIPHTTNLIGRGKTKLDKLVFSMFAASNEELLKDFINTKAIYGGLLGRLFLVIPDEFRPGNAFPLGIEKKLIGVKQMLVEISKLSGEVQFPDDAKEFYKEWYLGFREHSRKQNDRTGVLGRLPTNVKKLAMLLAANDLSLVVRLEHIDQAITTCLKLLPNYKFFTLQAGKSDQAAAGVIILETLSKRDILNYKDLIWDNWMNADSETFDKVIATFEVSGLIMTTVTGSERTFQLTAKGKEILGK